MNKLLAAALILLSGYLFPQSTTYIKQTGDHITIGNNFIEREIYLAPKKIGTVKIVNKLAGTTYVMQSDEFELGVVFAGCGPAYGKAQNGENIGRLHINDFDLVDIKKEDLPGDVKRLRLELKYDGYQTGFIAAVNYEITPENYMKKWVEIKDTSYGMHLLDNIQVECFKLYTKHNLSHGGFGQPVFIDNIFLGVEYPSVENIIDNGQVMTGYTSGEKITKDNIVSHVSVIGAAKSKDKTEGAFLAYIDKIKVNGTRPFLLYNSWYDFRNRLIAEGPESIMNDQNVLNRIDTFNKYMTEKHGITLDAFVLDDGWDKYKGIWDIDSVTLPDGFAPFIKPLEKTHTSLGIWASPFCGYSNRTMRVDYGSQHGYERTGDYLCFAGSRYKEEFKRKMTSYASKYHLGYFKWDGFLLACNEASHGHPTGIYSREALISTYIDMMQEVRKIKPDMFINITIGSWLSPWWLKYSDCVWMQGEDYAYADVPSLNLRDKAITYRDGVLWNNYRKEDLLFPISSLMTHGIIKGRLNFLGGKDESLTSFSNEVMMYFGRGVMMWELYVSPDLLNEAEWNTIASSVKWAKGNKDILSNTKMILGNPLKGETYGYVHIKEDKGILLLRNPGLNSQEAKIKLTPSLGEMDPDKEYYVKVIYPYNYILPEKVKLNGEIKLNLEGYQVFTAELIPSDKMDSPLPLGIRYETSDAGLKLYGLKGTKMEVAFTGSGKTEKVKFEGERKEITYSEISNLSGADGLYSVKVKINVPDGYENTTAAFLFEPSVFKGKDPEMDVFVNGTKSETASEHEKGKWYWSTALLKVGDNTVEYKLNTASGLKGKLSLRVLSEEMLSSIALKKGNNYQSELLPSKPFPADVNKTNKQLASYTVQ